MRVSLVGQAGRHEGGSVRLIIDLVERDPRQTVLGIAQKQLGVRLPRLDARNDISLVRQHDDGLIALLDVLVGLQDGVDDVIRLGGRSQAPHVRSDLPAGIANRVALQAGEVGAAVDLFATMRVAGLLDFRDQPGHLLVRKFPRSTGDAASGSQGIGQLGMGLTGRADRPQGNDRSIRVNRLSLKLLGEQLRTLLTLQERPEDVCPVQSGSRLVITDGELIDHCFGGGTGTELEQSDDGRFEQIRLAGRPGKEIGGLSSPVVGNSRRPGVSDLLTVLVFNQTFELRPQSLDLPGTSQTAATRRIGVDDLSRGASSVRSPAGASLRR